MSITILTDKNVIIRKERQCFGCYRKFPKGTEMHYQTNIYEGEFGSHYLCLTCEELRDFSEKEDGVYNEGFSYEDKAADNFEGSFEEYLAHLKANAPAYPYPHVHTPLPDGGHVTSDAPLTPEATEEIKKIIEHFTHDPLEGMFGV